MKKIAFPLLILFAGLLFWDYLNFQQEGRSLELARLSPIQVNSVSSTEVSDAEMQLECDSTNDAFIILPFSEKNRFWKRLQIDFRNLKGIRAVEIFVKEVDRKGFSKLDKKFVTGKNGVFTWYLPAGEYSHLRIDFDGHQKVAKPKIADIAVKDFSLFFSCELYLYFLAVVIFGLFVLPGSLIYLIVAKDLSRAPKNNLLYLFANSILFYFILYLFEYVAIETGVSPTITVTAALLAGMAALLVILKLRRRTSLLGKLFLEEKKSFSAAIILVLICCMFVTKFNQAPFTFDSVNENTLDRLTIFSQFPGHDNQFQYINGKAIADNEPFSKYYRNHRLFYDVQDRGMLPGVIYSVFRTFFTTFSSYIGGSYLTYTIVGLCMNIMVIFPLIVFFRRFFPPHYQSVFLLVLCLNTFVFPNFYFTWFKFSGAALFISGLLLLLESRRYLTIWMMSGFMFGLAGSMHAGNALGIPLFFLWLTGLTIAEFGFWSRQLLLAPLSLFITFVLVNLPWSLVKALHFPDTHALIIEHFFPAKRGPTLMATIRNFFATHTLQNQLDHRLGNVIEGIRLAEFGTSFQTLREKGVTQFIRNYNDYQFFYFMYSVTPLLCFALIGKLLQKLIERSRKSVKFLRENNGNPASEAFTLFGLSMLTIIGLVFVAYSDLPDVNHALPAGPILMIHTLLIGWILQSGKSGQLLLAVYVLFSGWRIVMHSLLFIFV